jgi:hypothetical protein
MSGFEIQLGLIRPRGEDPRPVGSPIPDASVTTLAAARHPCNLYYPTLVRASNCTVQLLAEPCPSTAATDWQRRAAGLKHLPLAATPAACLAAGFPSPPDIPIRASVRRRDDWPPGLFAAPVAPPGPAQHVSSLCLACTVVPLAPLEYKLQSYLPPSFSPSPRLRAPV